jgi:LmbE family N-acetylglucosaminyl deacetylase
MLKLNMGGLRTILCLGAHADDIEIGCGGTILRWLQEYRDVEVHWVVLSSDPRRKKEALKGSQLFLRGASQTRVSVERFRDGFLPYVASDVKEYFEGLKSRVNPDIIFTHYREDRHQDHRIVSDLTWNTFRNHLILEYEIPKFDGDLGQPNFFVNLDAAICRKKIQLILDTFKSQRDKHWLTENTLWALPRLRGIEAAATTNHCEAFYCRKIAL